MTKGQAILAIVMLLVGGVLGSVISRMSESSPAPTVDHRLNAAGYHKVEYGYQAPPELRFGGQPVGVDSEVFIEEYGIKESGNGSLRPTQVGVLLSGSADAQLVVTDFNQLEGVQRGFHTIEERAIINTRDRLRDSQPVNVLVGRLYGLRVKSSQDFQTGAFDSETTTSWYENSILYVERLTDDTLVTVVVTVNYTSEENWRAVLTSGMPYPPAVDSFFNSVRGTTLVTTAKPTPFVDERSTFQVWNARPISLCEPAELSSRCLYKAQQKDGIHQSQQQAVLVAKSGMLEINRERSPGSDLRFVHTFPAVQLPGGKVLRIGLITPERTKDADMRDPAQQMTALLQGGGKTYDSRALAAVKAYSLN